jgi:aryl-alcohol dehydrogenase-like predicted oxidoreductase
MPSKLVIGGHKLGIIGQIEARKILSNPINGNVLRRLDTAPDYVNSESTIGRNNLGDSKFSISTKCLNHKLLLSPNQMETQFMKSLENLRVKAVQYLFIHTTKLSEFSPAHFRKLQYLKSKNLFENLGYSGDNEDLNNFFTRYKYDLDAYMVTNNIVDQSNRIMVERIKSSTSAKVFSKRSIANGFWSNKNRLRKFLGRELTDRQLYKQRWKVFEKEISLSNLNLLKEFYLFNYLDSHIDFVCVGITSYKQLEELSTYEVSGTKMINSMNLYHDIWRKSFSEVRAVI